MQIHLNLLSIAQHLYGWMEATWRDRHFSPTHQLLKNNLENHRGPQWVKTHSHKLPQQILWRIIWAVIKEKYLQNDWLSPRFMVKQVVDLCLCPKGKVSQCLQCMSLLNQQVFKKYPAFLKRTSTSLSILKASIQVWKQIQCVSSINQSESRIQHLLSQPLGTRKALPQRLKSEWKQETAAGFINLNTCTHEQWRPWRSLRYHGDFCCYFWNIYNPWITDQNRFIHTHHHPFNTTGWSNWPRWLESRKSKSIKTIQNKYWKIQQLNG